MKILTAEGALLLLGKDYRFDTKLLADSNTINNGKLVGNVYLVQSGDPVLTYKNVQQLIAHLKNKKITTINGNFYIDDSSFDKSYFAPGWVQEDLRHCYGAPISASIIDHNCLAWHFLPKHNLIKRRAVAHAARYARGKQTAIKIADKSGKYSTNKQKTTSNMSIKQLLRHNSVDGVLTYNSKLITKICRELGVKVTGQVMYGKAPHSLITIAVHQSPPVKSLVMAMLKQSDNVIAGALFKKLGQVYTNKTGTWERGSIAVKQLLVSQVGVTVKGLQMIDGSGLSWFNKITPRQMMQILEFNYHNQRIKTTFLNSLSIAGRDGTLKNRLQNIATKVRAKTGSMYGVVSLAGYVWTKNHEPLAFVVIINNNGPKSLYRDLIDRIVRLLAAYHR
jgi:D-alanyl-D-alanine carboxypeptidase/D-alanyl-D-alanine-endopeptidase (penicillin-binding protein 4)